MELRPAVRKYISEVVVMLTAGHSGMLAGQYLTPTKDWKRHEFEDGSIIYEGEFNRTLKSLVMFYLNQLGIKYIDIDPEQMTISRSERCRRINGYHTQYPNAIHLDLHANAFDENIGTGCELWLPKKEDIKVASKFSEALELANCLVKEYQLLMSSPSLALPKLPFRGIKQKNWDMVFYTTTPSIIVECPFMTTEKECKAWLMTLEGRIQLAKWISSGILEYIKTQKV